MNRDYVIKAYRKIFLKNPARARQLARSLPYRNDHQLLQMIAETYYSEAAFSNGVQKKTFDNRKRRIAETYIVKAFKIKPTCTNTLWTLAKIRASYQQYDAAIFCYQEIIRVGVRGTVGERYRNELDVAKAQINDSKFQLYRLLYKSNPSLAKRYLTLYKKGLNEGIFTLFDPWEKFSVLRLALNSHILGRFMVPREKGSSKL
jgi:tetratricopeptide (TPR) repeat protein